MIVSLLLVLFSLYVEEHKQRERARKKEKRREREREREIVRTIPVQQE